MNPDIFKAYDVRGVYPAELDEAVFKQIGRGFVAFLKAKRVGIGRDMRVSSPSLAAAFIEGVREQGADVVDFGLIATDMLYYGVATENLDGGAQITASHNPKQYNGCKMVGRGAIPLSGDSGISVIGMPVASSIADAITAPTGITPASPAPFTPSGLSGDGVSMWSISMGGISVAYGIKNSMNDALRSCPSPS